MHYQINVSILVKKPGLYRREPYYSHLFTTTSHSCTNQHDLVRTLYHIREKFPQPEFDIAVTKHNDSFERIATSPEAISALLNDLMDQFATANKRPS